MPVMSNPLIATRAGVAGALLLALMCPPAMAAKICTLGPPIDGLSTVERSLGDCLERLRRYDGEPDGYGRVYARYGNADLAVDAAGSYRYYEDGQTWAQFAGAPGWKSVLLRDIDPPGKAEAAAEAEAAVEADPAMDDGEAAAEVASAAPVAAAASAAAAGSAGAAAVSFGAQRRATAETPVKKVEPKAPVVSRTESGSREVTYVDPNAVATGADGAVVRCQYRDAQGWQSSNHFTLEACATQIRAVHTQSNLQGVTQGYWNGIYIAVSAKSTYVSRDGGNAWEPLR